MIDIKRKLNIAFDEVGINKMLFDNIKYYKRIDFWLLISTIIFGGLIFVYLYKLDRFLLYWIIYIIVIVFGSFLILNSEYKKKLTHKNIKSEKGILKHWSNQEYEAERQNKFYDRLIKEGLLHNIVSDIDLIHELEDLCKEESSFFKTNKSYLVGGGIMLIFIIPLWSEIVKILIDSSTYDKFIDSVKLIIVLLTMVYMAVFVLYNIDNSLIGYTNSTSKKYDQIRKQLRLLRINLMIKFSQPTIQ